VAQAADMHVSQRGEKFIGNGMSNVHPFQSKNCMFSFPKNITARSLYFQPTTNIRYLASNLNLSYRGQRLVESLILKAVPCQYSSNLSFVYELIHSRLRVRSDLPDDQDQDQRHGPVASHSRHTLNLFASSPHP
jgi:hypothetical protein